MRKVISLPLVCFVALIFGCAQNSTLVDGTVDPVEIAVIQVAVGAAMSNLPSTVIPAYSVTSALLATRADESSTPIKIEEFDNRVKSEMEKLNLDPLTLQSCNELITLIEAKINQKLSGLGVPEDKRLVVVWQVIEVVNRTAQARLNMVYPVKASK